MWALIRSNSIIFLVSRSINKFFIYNLIPGLVAVVRDRTSPVATGASAAVSGAYAVPAVAPAVIDATV